MTVTENYTWYIRDRKKEVKNGDSEKPNNKTH